MIKLYELGKATQQKLNVLDGVTRDQLLEVAGAVMLEMEMRGGERIGADAAMQITLAALEFVPANQ